MKQFNRILLFFLLICLYIGISSHLQKAISKDLNNIKIFNHIYGLNVSLPAVLNQVNYKENVHAYLHYASQYETINQPDKAIEMYEKVIEEDPLNLIAHFNLGMHYYDKALVYLNYDGSVEIGSMYLDKSKEEFLWVQDINPRITMTYFKLGRIYSLQGNYDKAIHYYEEGSQLSPDNYVFYFNIGSIYDDTGDKDLAKINYLKCLKFTDNFPHVYNNLALIYEQEGNYKQAEKMYKNALKADKNYTYALLNLGSLYIESKNFKQAKKVLNKALSLEPDNPYVHMYLGYMYENDEAYYLAYKEYLKFVELIPAHPKGYYLLCRILNKMNRDSDALLAGIMYLNLEPEGKYAGHIKIILQGIQNKIIKSSIPDASEHIE